MSIRDWQTELKSAHQVDVHRFNRLNRSCYLFLSCLLIDVRSHHLMKIYFHIYKMGIGQSGGRCNNTNRCNRGVPTKNFSGGVYLRKEIIQGH